MSRARAQRDTRSAKRHARDTRSRATTSSSAARAVARMDDAIWTSIVEFMPIPRNLKPSHKEMHEIAVADVTTTWLTLLNLRLVSKKLAALLHPVENTTLWRRLVLQSFDFTTQATSNSEMYQDHDCLEENIRGWGALAIYYRPSQYGFLTTLQRQPPEGEWPESEDPFTLFGDLVRVLQLPSGEGMDIGDEGGYTAVKYLGAPADSDSSSESHQVRVMKTLGYKPFFWDRGCGIGDEWREFIDPGAFEDSVDEYDVDNHHGVAVYFDDHDDFGFPPCSLGEAKQLFRHISQHCRDWRSVCCNSGCDGITPLFFVGESKAAPHRWTGYTGQKCCT